VPYRLATPQKTYIPLMYLSNIKLSNTLRILQVFLRFVNGKLQNFREFKRIALSATSLKLVHCYFFPKFQRLITNLTITPLPSKRIELGKSIPFTEVKLLKLTVNPACLI
jgi:hypothetical protein